MRKGRFAGLVRGASPERQEAGAPTRADGFVALAEQQGIAWFWETDAHGDLAYVSAEAAPLIRGDQESLLGRPFAELLLVEHGVEQSGGRPAVGFHMESRFPFREIAVSPNGSRAVTWLLSGTPRFDEVGRFLGFRGFATPATPERQEQSEADRLGRFDSLTGLPNRAQMEALLDEALANSDRRKQSCALFLIDLDRFKQVNDTLGHPAGDVLLQRVAERLNAVIGGEGQAGRIGGDEFEAIFPGIGEEGRLAAIADRLIDTVSQPYLIHGHEVAIGASVGIAISRPGRTYRQALIKEADLALYSAKRAGRGTSRFFEPEMHAQENDRRVLESDLKSAVAKGQLKLLFQPIVSVATETVVGFEALVRWSHPTRGPLPPSDFLAIAEASGQMPVLGEWILRAACDEAASWPVHLRLAVNVTKGQLNPGFAAMLTNALASSGLSPARLDLEVQEAVLTGEDPAARDALMAAHQLGVALCLDDFGCGPTSLTSLKDVPLDRLKLHPTFLTSALNKNARGRTLATALMRLAEGLGMQVTAEGAERLEELQLIRSLGCDHVQGYLFGRPMGQAEARAFAAESKPIDAKEAALRRPPRHSLIRRATLHAGTEQWPVRLRNISAGGAMVESKRQLAVGQRVELDLGDQVRLLATVRWSHDERLGVQFTDAFDLARFGRVKRDVPEVRMLTPEYLQESPAVPSAPAVITIKKVRRS